MIRSNLKALADANNKSIRQVAKDIDYHFEPVRRLYNDQMERYPRDLIGKLCKYFGCEVSDLLKVEEG
jgi:putative transcriptional regulator